MGTRSPLALFALAVLGMLVFYLIRPVIRFAGTQNKARYAVLVTLSRRIVGEDSGSEFYARRSDGVWSHFVTIRRPDGKITRTYTVTNPATGKVVFVWPERHATRTRYLQPYNPALRFASPDDPQRSCTAPFWGKYMDGRKVVGVETILGQRVFHIRTTAGSFHDEWRAPAMGCLPLRFFSGNHLGEGLEMVATAIEPGEPPSELFTIPADYTEVSSFRR